MRRAMLVLAAAGMAAPASGQVRSWAVAGNGSWGDASRWSPADVPDSGAETASIATTGSYIVTLSGSYGIGALALSNPDAELHISDGSVLWLMGDSVNAGRVRINPGQGGNATILRLTGGTTLSGGGEIVLSAAGEVLDRAYIYNDAAGGNNYFVNGSGHTIRGTGRIYYGVVNQGTIAADVPGSTIEFTSSTVANSWLLAAMGGTLRLPGTVVTQTGGGGILAQGSNVTLQSASITGGTMAATAGGRIVSEIGTQTLSGVTVNGPMDINDGTYITAAGDLDHTGTLTVNAQSGPNATILRVRGGGALTGTGEIVLNATGGVLDRAYIYNDAAGGNNYFVNSSTKAIRGSGRIYYGLVNQGTISADRPGEFIELTSGPADNSGVIKAAGGELRLTGMTVTQAGGVIAAEGSDVHLVSTSIAGGTLAASGGGVFISEAGTQTLTNVTLSGDLDINDTTNLSVQGVLTHAGTITVNTSGGGNATIVLVQGGGTLAGSGDILLNATGDVLDRAYIYNNGAGGSNYFINGPGRTIHGSGRIYYGLRNQGLVSADRSGAAIELTNGPIDNTGTLRAEGGGELRLSGTTLAQSGGGALRAQGANVTLTSTSISGGSAIASGGGRFVCLAGAQHLSGVAVDGLVDVTAGTNIYFDGGGLSHAGVVTLNTAAANQTTIALMPGGGTLGGAGLAAGELRLNAPAGNLDAAYLFASSGTMTQAATHTLSGVGRVYGNFVNQGTISPGAAGSAGVIDFQYGPSLTLTGSSGLLIDMVGSGPDQHDRVTSTVPVQLGGTLTVAVAGGFVPAPCSTYTVVSSTGSVTGSFSNINLLGAGSGGVQVEYLSNAVVLTFHASDYNGDGSLDDFDYFDFLNDFFTTNPRADVNHDDSVDDFDYFDFLNAFFAGC
ncbi:MAG: hypothetical protein JNM07_04245 [Phycisphaerae bacterium]|nr:hypothetical protein [Phycisphaerae bacterium]